jgi:DNA-binding transcriptional regulator YiaG
MRRTLSEKIAQLPRARREKVNKRAAELVAEEMSLRELRHALGRTQAKLATDLGVGQDTVSRYEQRADMLLSTLRHYVAKMGGKLALVAEFPDRKPVRITGFGEIAESAVRTRGAR